MAAREDTVKMFRSGLTPGEISKRRRVNLNTTLPYLDEMVGRGAIQRSDIFFSIPADRRKTIIDASTSGPRTTARQLVANLRKRGTTIDEADVEVVWRYGSARSALGDMYENLRAVEVGFHILIRTAIEAAYGSVDRWWTAGIPLDMREKCEERRRQDREPTDHPYSYVDLLDLRELVQKYWRPIADKLPRGPGVSKDQVRADLGRLNRIRRWVMHPCSGRVPSELDFEFVRALRRKLGF